MFNSSKENSLSKSSSKGCLKKLILEISQSPVLPLVSPLEFSAVKVEDLHNCGFFDKFCLNAGAFDCFQISLVNSVLSSISNNDFDSGDSFDLSDPSLLAAIDSLSSRRQQILPNKDSMIDDHVDPTFPAPSSKSLNVSAESSSTSNLTIPVAFDEPSLNGMSETLLVEGLDKTLCKTEPVPLSDCKHSPSIISCGATPNGSDIGDSSNESNDELVICDDEDQNTDQEVLADQGLNQCPDENNQDKPPEYSLNLPVDPITKIEPKSMSSNQYSAFSASCHQTFLKINYLLQFNPSMVESSDRLNYDSMLVQVKNEQDKYRNCMKKNAFLNPSLYTLPFDRLAHKIYPILSKTKSRALESVSVSINQFC